LRNRAILECLYSTGLRRSELCQLRLCDLDQGQGYVTVIAGKGGKSRSVPIGERALGWVGRYLEESRPKLLARAARPSDALFLGNRGKPMPPAGLYVIVRAALDRIGLSTGLGGCHLLRHAFSTHLLQHGAGVDAIGAMLGHSDLRATPTYTHVSLASLTAHIDHCRRQLGLVAPGTTP
jgi:integrase/recombinase XerD